ncbi:MAG: ABC transporter permease [Bacteroidales bacterium]|nr:ABC transporter permease [Bacteroidales bacterium]
MNLGTISIIIRREYLNRVRKKSFLVTTFVVPILMAALCVVPVVLMVNSKDKLKKVAVVDRSGIVFDRFENTETMQFEDYSACGIDSVKKNMEALGVNALLSISAIDSTNSVAAELFFPKPLGMDAENNIKHTIDGAVEDYRVESYDIPGLAGIMAGIKADTKLTSYTMDEEGNETISETGVYAVLSMVLGLIIFIFITLFGGMVMSAVIEEKSSRVVEVLVSSVKATELMFGKITGIALVAVTQFLLWVVLTFGLVGAAGSFIGGDKLNAMLSGGEAVPGMGVDAAAVVPGADGELSVILTTLGSLPYGRIIAVFLLFFVLGYLLYSSLFAAIGSAVENEGDTQQLQLPLTIPLMLGYFMAIYSFNAPDSAVAFWGSMIPFTSPIVMLARLPFGVETWEIAVSAVALALADVVFVWFSAKIYRVGILMFGKKSTWKDLWIWFRQN